MSTPFNRLNVSFREGCVISSGRPDLGLPRQDAAQQPRPMRIGRAIPALLVPAL